jgi:hypothetical protein
MPLAPPLVNSQSILLLLDSRYTYVFIRRNYGQKKQVRDESWSISGKQINSHILPGRILSRR